MAPSLYHFFFGREGGLGQCLTQRTFKFCARVRERTPDRFRFQAGIDREEECRKAEQRSVDDGSGTEVDDASANLRIASCCRRPGACQTL